MELTVTLMGMDWSTTNHIYNGNRTEWTPVWRVIPRKGESDLLITSIITDRIGRDEVLLPVNKNYDINLRKKLDIR